jgi:putative heme degradation protein
MKLYYNGRGYHVQWKSLMRKDMWYNMEPVKIKFTLPESVYKAILIDIKLDDENKTLRDIFRFNLLLQKDEISRDRDKLVVETNEYWKINSYLDRVSTTSRFRNGEVTVIFEVSVFEEEELDKSELRNLLLSELV